MSNAKLPLPIRIAIRDTYDAENSPVKKALAKLNSEVGYQFSLVFPWTDIHRDLAPSFPDATILVPSVCAVLTAYLARITSSLDDEKFQEAFLEKTSMAITRDINVCVGEQKDEDTTEIDRNGKWMFSMPQTGPQWYRTMLSRVGNDLEDVFLDRKKEKKATAPPAAMSASVVPGNDWVDLDPVTKITNKIRSLPNLSTLGKPESLFASVLPYYVIVTSSGPSIHIEGSHQRTLDLLHQYFQMHVRKNMNLTTHEPYFNVQLKQNYWGDRMYEVSITLSDQRTAGWAPHSGVSLVIAFLEGVCGYTLAKMSNGWYFFRRETPFE